MAAVVGGVNELVVLFGAGAFAAVFTSRRSDRVGEKPVDRAVFGSMGLGSLSSATAPLTVGAAGSAIFGSWPLFLTFLKIGSVLFGSGYVLLAFLRADFVDRLGWLTERQLLDAVAVGQLTPGPVFTTATFIGYLLGGWAGAAVATVGIFVPAFAFVAVSGLVLPYVRRSQSARAVLDGVNVASLALMAVVTYQLGRAALTDRIAVALAALAAVLLFRWRINTAWLILVGGVIGWIVRPA